jgi:hypothetical protein
MPAKAMLKSAVLVVHPFVAARPNKRLFENATIERPEE